ncbi:AAA family ATPase [Streptomyces sp. NPDC097981]|uniref:AAA family ATPase n=1 Tax=Streptomyces sp. NPDC097981 TaxID=3155428 RepID=UPI003330E4A1
MEHNTDQSAGPEGSKVLTRLLENRLAASGLSDATKELLRDALGDHEGGEVRAAGRVYLDSVSVAGFRGIGRKSWLSLTPKPGVTLVVGRNGSGKSSFAEAIETAFTGTSARWDGRSPIWRSNWRNLHETAAPKIEVKLHLEGDPTSSTLSCTWSSDDVTFPEVAFKRPGHSAVAFTDAGWDQPLADYRPFLSYADLDRMISGKPSEMYDAVATILGLGQLTDADDRLQLMEKGLQAALKSADGELPELLTMLSALDDPRAAAAIAALDHSGSPDFDAVASLVDGLPGVDGGELDALRATAALAGPDLDAVGSAVDGLREAAAVLDDVRASGAEDARQRAELLTRALEHSRRHPDESACPVCGSDRLLDESWAEEAADQIDILLREAATAQDARDELHSSMDALRYLISQAPAWLPAGLVDPWEEWIACRAITDADQLAAHAENAALVLADACAAMRTEAIRELERLDERWRRAAVRLVGWLDRARAAHAGKPRLSQVKGARKWLKEVGTELREARLRPFADHSQRIWEELRQQSNVDLRSVRLAGTDKASVRKLVTDVSVDGTEAAAVGVMSQGELHSLALSLFLPRAAAPDSPFGFVVIDDPVQSMDPAKVHGLAKVLHSLGESRQVVVFTHDTRLQRAFQSQELPVSVLEVERGDRSTVTVRAVTDPVVQALVDARAIASTRDLPQEATTHVLPGVCRTVLERAFAEAAWVRLHRSGIAEHAAEGAVTGATKLMEIAALGLFGDASRTGDVYRELRWRCGPRAVDLLKQCQEGAHPMGTTITDPHRFVDEIQAIAQTVRKPEVPQP